MKFFRVTLVLVLIMGLCISSGLAAEKGSPKGSGYEKKGSPTEAVGAEDVAVSGKIMFADYYSMAGKKCTAFLDAEDGSIYCVLDNVNAARLESELGAGSGEVKITGTMTKGAGARYIEIEEYEVKEKGPSKKEPGHERYEHKGSY